VLGGPARVDFDQHKIKVIIIIVLIWWSTQAKASVIDQEGQFRLTQVNVKIKVVIIVLKLILGVNRDKVQVTGWEGQHGLTRVNVWIKVVIIIVLKSDSEVNSRQGSGHGLGGSTRLT